MTPKPVVHPFATGGTIYGYTVKNTNIYRIDLALTKLNHFDARPDGSGTMVRPLKGTDKLVLGEYNPSSNVWTIHVPVYWSHQDRAAEENRQNTERINRISDQLQYGTLGVLSAPFVAGASIAGAPYVAIAAKAVTSAVGRLVINGAAKVASKVLSPGTAVTGGAGAVAGNELIKRAPAAQNILARVPSILEKASSVKLAENLKAAGVERPIGAAAHHIVAGAARVAQPARDVLQKFNIGINNAVNGVFLPANVNSPNPAGSTVHSTMHTNSYYMLVN